MLAEALRQFTENLRQRMERLMNGEQLSRSELEALGQMVGLNQTDDLDYQNWMAQRMMRAMAFPEVRKAMKELMEQLAQMGMSRERIQQIRNMIQQNMQGMQEQINQFAGERIAENLSEQPRADSVDNLMNRPFQALSDADKKILQREVQRLAAALRTRIALRQKRAKSGQLDPKATIRANLKYHGVPMEIKHQRPRTQTEDRGDLRRQHVHAFLFGVDAEFSVCPAGTGPQDARLCVHRPSRIDLGGLQRLERRRGDPVRFVAHAQRTLQHRPRLVVE